MNQASRGLTGSKKRSTPAAIIAPESGHDMLDAGMRRITVSLPDEIIYALERAARRRHTSVSAVVRAMIAAQLGLTVERERTLPFANLGRSGERHVARDMEA